MTADPNAEVRAELLELVRTFTANEIIPTAATYDHDDVYPEALVEKMKELGLFGITVPEEYGGLGLDILTYAQIVEELAYGWMSVSGFLNTHFMGCFLIKTYGTDDQKARFLPKMATGEIRAAYSLSEPDAGSDVAAIRTRAARDGDDYVVNGTKMWLTNGREARLVVTLVRTNPDPEAKTSGTERAARREGTGCELRGHHGRPEHPQARVPRGRDDRADLRAITGCRLRTCSGARRAWASSQMMTAVELGRINISARAVGVARRAFEESIRYAQQRETFGRPIAQHQAIQFKLAEMGTKLHAARLDLL